MKTTFLILALMLGNYMSLQAQGLAEWFNQKKTQKKHLVEQIAALKMYGSYIQKGYQVAQDGLHSIGSLSDGEFKLHTGHLDALYIVNPKIRGMAEVKDILIMQTEMLSMQSRLGKQLGKSTMTTLEQRYYQAVFGRVLDNCLSDLEQLNDLMRNGGLAMRDDERVSAVNRLHADMQDKYTFCRRLQTQALLSAGRLQKEQGEVKMSRIIYGLKK